MSTPSAPPLSPTYRKESYPSYSNSKEEETKKKGLKQKIANLADKIAPRNPVTKRRQIYLIPTKWVERMGVANYDNLCPRSLSLPDSDRRTVMVKGILNRLLPQCENKKFNYEIRVQENDKLVNAFALPGGKLVITTGLIEKIESFAATPKARAKGYTTESMVAAVVGHELVHAAANHGALKMQLDLVFRVTGFFFAKIFGIILATLIVQGRDKNRGRSTREIEISRELLKLRIALVLEYAFTFLWKITSFFLSNAHSRSKESEADRHGIKYAARAGYNVKGSIGLMEVLGEASGGKVKNKKIEYLHTHPLPQNRKKANKKLVGRIQKEGINKVFR